MRRSSSTSSARRCGSARRKCLSIGAEGGNEGNGVAGDFSARGAAGSASVFADFYVRFPSTAFETLLVALLATSILQPAARRAGLGLTDQRLPSLVALALYFAVFWASPLRATPLQLLSGERVVAEEGTRLAFVRALLRAVITVILVAAATSLSEVPGQPWFAPLSVAALALLFLTSMTPTQQAANDLAVHSVIVQRAAVASADGATRVR